MEQVERERNRDRVKAAVGVAAFHALLGYAFITGLGVEFATKLGDDLNIFTIPPERPPPPREEPVPAKIRTEAPEGAASPPSLRAKPSPGVAPPPKIRLDVPPPVVTAPLPTDAPPGNDPTAGASDVDGPGTGAGGEGTGTGSGGQGSGTGGGGGGVRAQRVSGSISGARDYPPAARRAGIEGTVVARFIVGVDGRVSGCSIIRSSADAELEATTCRLIERRFRYEPARDGQGKPVPEVVTRTFDWLLPFRR